jgi:DNA polymerase/3'-5' exonuclease PolX
MIFHRENVELGKNYLYVRMSSLPSSGRETNSDFKKRERVIAQAQINIPEFYSRELTLRELKIKGIGQATKEILEDILSVGVEGAIRKEVERKARPYD